MATSSVPNAKPFTKGDPRINRKGRPKNADKLRDLVQSVFNEPARDENGQEIVVSGHIATNVEMLIRRMLTDPRQSAELLNRGYGKVPQPLEHTGSDGGPIETRSTVAGVSLDALAGLTDEEIEIVHANLLAGLESAGGRGDGDAAPADGRGRRGDPAGMDGDLSGEAATGGGL